MQETPLVCTDRILDSLQDDDSLSLASFGDFIASDESFCEDVEELEKSLDVLKSAESDRATDSAEESCLSSPDDMTYASLGDPSDWPERRFLVSESLKSSASGENCTLSHTGGSPGLKELTISAAEIAKLFDEPGRPKRNPLHPVHAVLPDAGRSRSCQPLFRRRDANMVPKAPLLRTPPTLSPAIW
ncbi:uncharacterized protein LOC142775744 isoform X1 [Rhipicephalus microplus]|uniref:uncharacterized protein LOC142775744 isoform X1 n=1 Tax=Rhipicephalus microplus TaxID=6941 RepID=UPI003F6D4495